ncbi:hypothetical protein O181_067044 [Austropuccinia psidii MF-1]|uniref:Integrase zinc-binding domain-containing protein n=1 Tax=Austropuccinia psidii MF-1 TaxID=1389203 RepID=A0A9Q3EUM5_9BASI|nr:hypothetical protein [Austropuccinia psidii MF-1]
MVELSPFPSFAWEFLVIDTPKGEDLILGFDFLNHFNESIDWRKGLITFNPDHKDYYNPSEYFSNDLSSATSCAALSLLSSRDEVFKEIQDVVEDNSVPSLHLFFGNMDLPPSSYHDSLEELWDEEKEPEEVETVIKVFPLVYHQYLDVFSKVKAEKPPPHCACDHHIKLEESLPPSVSPTQRGFHHFSNLSLPTIVETNASDYALGAVLNKASDSGKHPIAFNSCKLIPSELNYEIHDKEPLGVVRDLKCWRVFLLSLSSSFEVLTYYSPLQYFMFSKVLTHCQACWAEFLPEFCFSITYRPGHLATLLDALSCWDDIYLEKGLDLISKNPMNFKRLIKQDEVQLSRYFAVKVESFTYLIDSIQKALWQYSQYRSILQELGKGKSVQGYSLDSSSQLLLFKDQVVVPNDSTVQLSILQKHHDSPLTGHPGQEKTLKLVKRDFHWSSMT